MKLNDTNREKSPDGKRLSVRGYFTSDQKDAVGDVITKEATMKAIPDYRQWGNIRYMHQPKPVGVVRAIGEDDGLEWNEVAFDITKPDVIEDVENGLLKALSVGILVDFKDIDQLQDGGWIINGYKLAEISLVDHPANYDARLKTMTGEDALSYVKSLYGSSRNVIVETKSEETQPVKEEKSSPCREENESKEDCVSRKIPELIDEGMDQDQAVAVANEMCSEACEQKSIMEDKPMDQEEKVLEEVVPVEDVADEELVETITTDETSAEKAIEPDVEDTVVIQEETLEDVNTVEETEKELDGEVNSQADEIKEEPVVEEKDITSAEETIVEDEFPEWVKSLTETISRLSEEISEMKGAISDLENRLQEADTEAEITQDVSEVDEELDKGLIVGENVAVEPDVQKGAMPETEIIEPKTDLGNEVPVTKVTLRDVLKARFNVE